MDDMEMLLSGETGERLLALHGERATRWLRQLSGRLETLRAQWGIEEFERPFGGAGPSLLVPVRTNAGARVLKLAPPSEWITWEARALAHWAGRGAVRLEQADLEGGALLLERAVPGTPLADLCAHDDRAATVAATAVILELRTSAGPSAGAFPTLVSWTECLVSAALAYAPPELRDACGHAHAVATELLAGAGPGVVLHGDLHHHNLLRTERASWLAIDPKGLEGPPEAEAAALLRNPRGWLLSQPEAGAVLADRTDLLSERLGDDARRIAGWGYVLAVLAALWAFEDHEGDDEVRRWLACARLLRSAGRERGWS